MLFRTSGESFMYSRTSRTMGRLEKAYLAGQRPALPGDFRRGSKCSTAELSSAHSKREALSCEHHWEKDQQLP